MENKETLNAADFLYEKLPNNFIKGWYNGTPIDPEEARIMLIEFANYHLTKQAEFIAEKAKIYDIKIKEICKVISLGGSEQDLLIAIGDLVELTEVEESIINAGEEYKNSVK